MPTQPNDIQFKYTIGQWVYHNNKLRKISHYMHRDNWPVEDMPHYFLDGLDYPIPQNKLSLENKFETL